MKHPEPTDLVNLRRYIYAYLGAFSLVACDSDSTPSPSERSEGVYSSSRARMSGMEESGTSITSLTRLDLDRELASISTESIVRQLKEIGQVGLSPEDKQEFEKYVVELAKRDPKLALSLYDPKTLSHSPPGWWKVSTIICKGNPDLFKSWLLYDLSSSGRDIQSYFLHAGLQTIRVELGMNEAFSFYDKIKTMEDKEGILLDNEIANIMFASGSLPKSTEVMNEQVAAAKFHLKGEALDIALYNISAGAYHLDIKKALEVASQIRDRDNQSNVISAIYSHAAASDPDGTWSALEGLENADLENILRARTPDLNDSLFGKLGKQDPERLHKLLNSVIVSSQNQSIFSNAVQILTSSSPETAKKVVDSLPEGKMKDSVTMTYFIGILQADPVNASSSFKEIPAGKTRDLAYTTLARNSAAKLGYEGTLEQMKNSIPLADQGVFLNAAIPQLGRTNPMDVAKLLDSDLGKMLDQSAREQVLANVGQSFTSNDPKAAITWLGGLNLQDQPQAMKGIASELVRADVQSLVNFLSDFPKNETWATGVRTIVQDLKNSDPTTASEWQSALKEAGFKD